MNTLLWTAALVSILLALAVELDRRRAAASQTGLAEGAYERA